MLYPDVFVMASHIDGHGDFALLLVPCVIGEHRRDVIERVICCCCPVSSRMT